MDLYLPIKVRYELRNRFLRERLENLLPDIMNSSNIDMWVVAAKECNEDPVMFSMLPAPMMSARRTTILLFVKQRDGSVERFCLGRKNAGLDFFYTDAWPNQKESDWELDSMLMPARDRNEKTGQAEPEFQMECLSRLVRKYDPQKIGLNISEKSAFADGLSHSLYLEITQAIGAPYRDRVVSAEMLCFRWLETRTDSELYFYRQLVKKAHSIINEGLSGAAIHPGVTTTRDLGYWLMEEGERCGFFNWFNAVISIRRGGKNIGGDETILPGDLVHVDVGYECMGYFCDSQANSYVLKPEENEPPAELVQFYRDSRKAHRILERSFEQGATGDEVLLRAREEMGKQLPGIIPFIYAHPIGVHGHAAGPNIGRTDNQRFVREMGWYPVHENTLFAMEMCVIAQLKEWNAGPTVIGLETETIFRNGRIEEIDPQNELMVVHTV